VDAQAQVVVACVVTQEASDSVKTGELAVTRPAPEPLAS
jgi:hypothetical protein